MEAFGDYAYYYNAFYRDKDYKQEAETVHRLLTKYGSNVQELINFGCGTGRHDIELAKLGYHCQGIDISPMMIDIAKKNSVQKEMNIDFSVHDIRSFKADSPKDAVISLFHVLCYQIENIDIMNAFKAARASLKKGGLFLFEVWYGPGVLSDKPTVRVKEVEDEKHKLIRIARPIMHDKENSVDIHYEILIIDKETYVARQINEVHHMRYFFRPELDLLLGQTGFELVDNIDCRSLGETDYNSWTSYFIAKAL